jgi:enoyl-CoA hydratase/carnithine racemase
MDDPPLLIDDRLMNGTVLRVLTLNRAAKRNCLSVDLMRGLIDATRGAPDAWIVFRGSPAAFCTGLDLVELYQFRGVEAHLELLVELLITIAEHPRPTVSAIEGFAYGGGAAIASCCDAAVAGPKARIKLPGNGALRPMVDVVVPCIAARRALEPGAVSAWIGINLEPSAAVEARLIDAAVDDVTIDAGWPEMSRLAEMNRTAFKSRRVHDDALRETRRLLKRATNEGAVAPLMGILTARYGAA